MSERSEFITDTVKRIIKEQLNVDEKDIKLEANLTDDLGADSLDLVEINFALEEEFGTEVPDEDAEEINTVQELINYFESHMRPV